jgi:hypothetical protein
MASLQRELAPFELPKNARFKIAEQGQNGEKLPPAVVNLSSLGKAALDDLVSDWIKTLYGRAGVECDWRRGGFYPQIAQNNLEASAAFRDWCAENPEASHHG